MVRISGPEPWPFPIGLAVAGFQFSRLGCNPAGLLASQQANEELDQGSCLAERLEALVNRCYPGGDGGTA